MYALLLWHGAAHNRTTLHVCVLSVFLALFRRYYFCACGTIEEIGCMNRARFAGILTMVKIVKHPGENQGGLEV